MAKKLTPEDCSTLRTLLKTHFTYDTESGHLALRPNTPREIVSPNSDHYFHFHTMQPYRVLSKHRILYFLAHDLMPNYVLHANGDFRDDTIDNLIGAHDPHGKNPAQPETRNLVKNY